MAPIGSGPTGPSGPSGPSSPNTTTGIGYSTNTENLFNSSVYLGIGTIATTFASPETVSLVNVDFNALENYISNIPQQHSIGTYRNAIKYNSTYNSTNTSFTAYNGWASHMNNQTNVRINIGYNITSYYTYIVIPPNIPAKAKFVFILNIQHNSAYTQTTYAAVSLNDTYTTTTTAWSNNGPSGAGTQRLVTSAKSISIASGTTGTLTIIQDVPPYYIGNSGTLNAFLSVGFSDTGASYTVSIQPTISYINV